MLLGQKYRRLKVNGIVLGNDLAKRDDSLPGEVLPIILSYIPTLLKRSRCNPIKDSESHFMAITTIDNLSTPQRTSFGPLDQNINLSTPKRTSFGPIDQNILNFVLFSPRISPIVFVDFHDQNFCS